MPIGAPLIVLPVSTQQGSAVPVWEKPDRISDSTILNLIRGWYELAYTTPAAFNSPPKALALTPHNTGYAGKEMKQ
ncbi:MAG: hypothetical protein GX228_05010 [Firmicutes bacterium]|jgi:hypothetical protein|nr:hypothetical protein [Bacillota bacterium]NLL88281.1 hypothetical protein [Bacillota bacterium]HKM18059.1 hypothetical protein [Limnochordia bacterium]